MQMPSSLILMFIYVKSVFFCCKSTLYLYYTSYIVRSMSGNSPRDRCLWCSVSVSKSPEDPHGFCRQPIGNEALNNNPDNYFTHDIATNESPGVKSTSPRSMTALSNVSP